MLRITKFFHKVINSQFWQFDFVRDNNKFKLFHSLSIIALIGSGFLDNLIYPYFIFYFFLIYGIGIIYIIYKLFKQRKLIWKNIA